jgi:branched-chain amino acid transport system ATP-binding protein
MSDEIILSVDNLMMQFGGIKALSDVSLKVKRNQIFALIGPNGAGKTTVFNCLTGFYKASGGRIELNVRGSTPTSSSCWASVSRPPTSCRRAFRQPHVLQDVRRHPPGQPRGLARTFQNIRLFKEMSVVENLLVAQHMWVNRNLLAGVLTKGYRKAESDALDHAFYWLEVVDLVDCANRLAGELSYGQQRRLEIARAMCTRPRSSAWTNRPPASTLRKPKRSAR